MLKAKQIDDLTPEEINDIQEFRNNSQDGKTMTLEELVIF